MGKRFGSLEDKDIIGCYVAAYRKDGLDEVVFEKNIAQMKSQKEEELIQLSQDLEKLEIVNKISNKEFYRQAMIYLLSNQENIPMTQASELFVKLEQERDKMPEGDYGKIIKALELSKYDHPKPKSNKVEKLKEPDLDDIEWVQAGTVKLESLKKKYRR